MPYIDLHCDTLMQAALRCKRELLRFPEAAIDLERLRTADCLAQFFAVFLPPPTMLAHHFPCYAGDDAYLLQCRQVLMHTIQANPSRLALSRTAADLEQNRAAGKVSAFLTIEDGRSVGGKLEKLEGYYDLGVRLLTLTWNAANCFGAPNSDDPETMQQGLTAFGKEAVAYMEELGMLVDVSHLSDGGFRDVAELCKGPFVASHSNCRTLCPHRRNLTDGMLRCLAKHGGVAGLNFYPAFLGLGGGAAALAKHARHMADVGGVEVVAIGTDLDGFTESSEIDSPESLCRLWNALKKEGFSEDDIERIAWRNAARVLRDVL